ncbi:MAG: hypothetical protein ACI87E_004733 [Mariniblastus sp.]|jgi:hypothetical protein
MDGNQSFHEFEFKFFPPRFKVGVVVKRLGVSNRY